MTISSGLTSPSSRPITSADVLSPSDQPMRPSCHRSPAIDTGVDWCLWHVILALNRAIFAQRVGVLQQRIKVVVSDAQQRQVEILGQQPRDLVAQRCLVPFAVR